MFVCRVCRSPRLQFITDFGSLAITSQFVTEGGTAAYRQPMSWHECLDCSVVQLTDVPPVDQIRCRFPWLTYREPERHLGDIAQALLRVAGRQDNHFVVGLAKDDLPLMQRLGQNGSILIDPIHDLEISTDNFGVETIQSRWTVEHARRAVEKYGSAGILIARYVLEHAHDAHEFLLACRTLLASDGILVIEVPDCSQAFRDLDVTVLWEEHSLYFTESSLQRTLAACGFELLHFQRVPDGMEDRLVWIGRPATIRQLVPADDRPSGTDSDVRHFAINWPGRRAAIHSWAESIQQDHGRLAVFGAGHRACTLIDTTNISQFIHCMLDDTKEKQQLKFPAGNLPIYGSAALVDRKITHCLFALNPEVEDRIVERNAPFVNAGGTFVSCYARSPRAQRFS